jgi:flagellar basal body-associated protein FliL
LSFKGTPGKRLLWISIVVILVILAAAYFLFISPR